MSDFLTEVRQKKRSLRISLLALVLWGPLGVATSSTLEAFGLGSGGYALVWFIGFGIYLLVAFSCYLVFSTRLRYLRCPRCTHRVFESTFGFCPL